LYCKFFNTFIIIIIILAVTKTRYRGTEERQGMKLAGKLGKLREKLTANQQTVGFEIKLNHFPMKLKLSMSYLQNYI